MIIVLLIIGLASWWFLSQQRKPSVVYATATVLSGSQTVPEGEIHSLKDNATLTVEGDYTVDGILRCDDGIFTLIVNGNLTVNGQLRCERPAEIDDTDLGTGISLVVSGNVEFGPDSSLVSNGHIQLVDDISKLAKSQEDIDRIFEQAAADTGEGMRLGPFIEIPLAPGQAETTLVPAAIKTAVNEISFFQKVVDSLVSSASAQEAAVDEQGRPVPNTVKIGGTWVVGSPAVPPPAELQVPIPPKKVKKIIVAFDFGGANMNISDFTLYGPDGSSGSEDIGSCNVKGGNGSDAYRLNITAPNVTINNFTVFLGYGGKGGFAETDTNCDPGKATGGDGGKPSNMKIIGTNEIEIVGSFTINPGQGGQGGQAIAHGKTGKDGCPAEKGGDADATGGQGGDNKKGLKVTGNVSGTANVVIGDIVAGAGGSSDANGGNGGNGTGPACAGGAGGKATATGGQGGIATSRTNGGMGGSASAVPGNGGNGGTGSVTEAGGNGGNGGNAMVKAGKGGTGKTSNGEAGTIFDETGGKGGNGGDGCPEGKGGKGGSGNPNGEKGDDGKNICPPANTNTNTGVIGGTNININANVNTNTNTNINTNTGVTPPQPVNISPKTVRKTHVIGESSCPDQLGSVAITGPVGQWQLTIPAGWITSSKTSGQLGAGGAEVDLNFNCNITSFTTHTENTRATVKVTTADGQTVNSFFDIFMDIVSPE